MKKNPYLIELLVFFVLISIVMSGIYNVFRYKNVGSGGGMDNYYDTKVPIDVIIYGSSHAACTVNNGVFWQDYGIASYTLSAGGQTIDGTYYFLQESIAVNKPKIALVETYLLTECEFSLASYYRSALTSKFSKRFLDYTLNVVKDNSLDRETAENMIFRMPIVHSRYKELEKGDFINSAKYIRGYRGSNEMAPIEGPQVTDRYAEISEDALMYIDKMINLCKNEGVELIFFNAPYEIGEEAYAKQNTLRDYVIGKGCQYIGFNGNNDVLKLDYGSDFRDPEHLNDNGAEKVTRALAEFITENCPVQDRRGSKGYELWDRNIDYLNDRKLKYKLNDCRTLDEYWKVLYDNMDGKTCILSLNGNYRALGDEIYKPYLGLLGIDSETYEKGGVWVIRNGDIIYYSGGANTFHGYQMLGENVDLNIYKNEIDEFADIWIDDEDLSPDCNGISVLLYDEDCNYIIHGMKVDVYNGTEVTDIELPD